ENIFIFGLTVEEVRALKSRGYNPRDYYHANPELRRAVQMLEEGYFSPARPGLCSPLINSLLHSGDPFMVMADYQSYVDCQQQVSQAYRDVERWTRMAILNCARVGLFSSDRTIREYASQIWHAEPVDVVLGDGREAAG
ncbi:MAG: glycogen/starch/alpha-glucan phosphorylase, partial [Candidatus Latescibacterota bacterium]